MPYKMLPLAVIVIAIVLLYIRRQYRRWRSHRVYAAILSSYKSPVKRVPNETVCDFTFSVNNQTIYDFAADVKLLTRKDIDDLPQTAIVHRDHLMSIYQAMRRQKPISLPEVNGSAPFIPTEIEIGSSPSGSDYCTVTY